MFFRKLKDIAFYASSNEFQNVLNMDEGWSGNIDVTRLLVIHSQIKHMGPVVQSWISDNTRLKFTTCCFSLCISASLFISKLQRTQLQLIQTRFLKTYFQMYKQAVGKFALNFRLTLG
jgi:hypothetical protein